jgi:hypothetical protein
MSRSRWFSYSPPVAVAGVSTILTATIVNERRFRPVLWRPAPSTVQAHNNVGCSRNLIRQGDRSPNKSRVVPKFDERGFGQGLYGTHATDPFCGVATPECSIARSREVAREGQLDGEKGFRSGSASTPAAAMRAVERRSATALKSGLRRREPGASGRAATPTPSPSGPA